MSNMTIYSDYSTLKF